MNASSWSKLQQFVISVSAVVCKLSELLIKLFVTNCRIVVLGKPTIGVEQYIVLYYRQTNYRLGTTSFITTIINSHLIEYLTHRCLEYLPFVVNCHRDSDIVSPS